jgi:hypothetical protein
LRSDAASPGGEDLCKQESYDENSTSRLRCHGVRRNGVRAGRQFDLDKSDRSTSGESEHHVERLRWPRRNVD